MNYGFLLLASTPHVGKTVYQWRAAIIKNLSVKVMQSLVSLKNILVKAAHQIKAL
jgi:hypothetical protein